MNFSQFMSRAADEYSQKVESQSVTDQINAVLEAAGHDDSNRMAARASHETLRRSEW